MNTYTWDPASQRVTREDGSVFWDRGSGHVDRQRVKDGWLVKLTDWKSGHPHITSVFVQDARDTWEID